MVLEGATAAANRERQMDAVEWLLTCPPTARFWIQAAGLDPENVASRLRARLSDRVVRMTEKRARLR